MVVKLTMTGQMDRIITHDNKLKTDEFCNIHGLASAVRHLGGRNTVLLVMFRI